MNESRTPWWLIVLLAIAIASLAIWQSVRLVPQMRRGAGCLALFYLALLSFAIDRDPRGASSLPATLQISRTADVVLLVVGGVCIAAAVFLLGRPALRGQLAWFASLSVGNAVLCFLTGNGDVACALLLVGAAALMVLIKTWHRGESFRLAELLPAAATDSDYEPPYASWLTGGTGFLLAVLLIGTCHYVAHAETTRATASQRHSALPTPARLRSVLVDHLDAERTIQLSDLAVGRRADVVVLLAVLTFVSLASTMSTRK